MKKLRTISIILVIALLYWAYYSTLGKRSVSEMQPPPESKSILGCYVLHIAKDVHVLKINSETSGNIAGTLAFNNYEKDSSYGEFTGTYKDGILFGNYGFDSEGMHSNSQVAFKKVENGFVRGNGPMSAEGDTALFEDVAKLSYEPDFVFVKSADCVLDFVEVNNKFSFKYDGLFHAFEPIQEFSNDWRQNTEQKGMLMARISIPQAYLPKTNFGNAYLTVGSSTIPEAIKKCTSAQNGEVESGQKIISGYPFKTFILNEAGAGNFYETTSYRGLLDGDCYAVEYTIHSTNLGSYSPEQNIQAFDKSKIVEIFESMISSFHFNVNSD